MPIKMWRHDGGSLSSRDCDQSQDGCRERNVCVGWHFGMHENMARYQYSYGLKPIGPHRRMADLVLTPLRRPCVRCEGRGILDLDGGASWSACPACEGTGGIWSVSEAEFAAVRGSILNAHPDAAAPPVRFFGVALALGVDRNIMVDFGVPPRRRAPAPKRRERTSQSRDGLLLTDVEHAFAKAQRRVGSGLKLKGRGHCRRVSLTRRYANCAVKGAGASIVWVRVPGSWNPRRLIPRVIVEKAAEILGVSSSLFIRREY